MLIFMEMNLKKFSRLNNHDRRNKNLQNLKQNYDN